MCRVGHHVAFDHLGVGHDAQAIVAELGQLSVSVQGQVDVVADFADGGVGKTGFFGTVVVGSDHHPGQIHDSELLQGADHDRIVEDLVDDLATGREFVTHSAMHRFVEDHADAVLVVVHHVGAIDRHGSDGQLFSSGLLHEHLEVFFADDRHLFAVLRIDELTAERSAGCLAFTAFSRVDRSIAAQRAALRGSGGHTATLLFPVGIRANIGKSSVSNRSRSGIGIDKVRHVQVLMRFWWLHSVVHDRDWTNDIQSGLPIQIVHH